jgi:cysteine desulfurase
MNVYCDNAATSPLRKVAFEAMVQYLSGDGFGNASSIYAVARQSKKGLEDARRLVASCLGTLPEEIYFTSGGTESDNWALKGALEQGAKKGRTHLVTTVIEHPAILESAKWLEKQGNTVTRVPVDSTGLVSVQSVLDALTPETAIVSIMYANNEIGTIQPIDEIFAAVKAKDPKILCHTDAVQATGHIALNLDHTDLLSISSHKIGGPKGVGVLFVRKGVALPPLLHGGGHERGKRSSTENVAGIVGLATALKDAYDTMDATIAHLEKMRHRLEKGLLVIPHSKQTGHPTRRLPGNASFVFECVEGESLVLTLDRNGISSSSGSACSSGSLDPSHVLLAIGLPHEIAHGSLRLTLGDAVTEEEIDYVVKTVVDAVAQLRSMSPLWDSATGEVLVYDGQLFEHH